MPIVFWLNVWCRCSRTYTGTKRRYIEVEWLYQYKCTGDCGDYTKSKTERKRYQTFEKAEDVIKSDYRTIPLGVAFNETEAENKCTNLCDTLNH